MNGESEWLSIIKEYVEFNFEQLKKGPLTLDKETILSNFVIIIYEQDSLYQNWCDTPRDQEFHKSKIRAIIPFTDIAVTIELADSNIVIINDKFLKDIPLSFNEIFNLGVQTTKKRYPLKDPTSMNFIKEEPSLVFGGDHPYVSTHALLLEENNLVGKYGTVFAIPASNSLVVHPIEHGELRPKVVHSFLHNVVSRFHDAPYRISPYVYLYRDKEYFVLK